MSAEEHVRNIVNVNKPFDTGEMFLNGSRHIINNNMHIVKYDVKQVPHIIFQEEGTIFFDGNKNFIKTNTVTEIMMFYAMNKVGQNHEQIAYRDLARAQSSMISQGVIQSYSGDKRGGRADEYIY